MRKTWQFDPYSAPNAVMGLGYLLFLSGVLALVAGLAAYGVGIRPEKSALIVGCAVGICFSGIFTTGYAMWLRNVRNKKLA